MRKFKYRTIFVSSKEKMLEQKGFFLRVKNEVLWKNKSLAKLCNELGILLESGLMLVSSLEVIIEGDSWTKRERTNLKKAMQFIVEGKSFSEALRLQGKTFPHFMVNAIQVAEEAGGLGDICMRLGKYYNLEYKRKQKIQQQLNYPLLVCGLTLILVFVFMNYVLPQFQSLFDLMEELPWPTRVLYETMEFFGQYGIIVLAVLFVLIILCVALCKVRNVIICVDRLKLKIPIVRKVLQMWYTAQFSYTLNFLYCAGIPLVRGIELAGKTIGNAWIEVQLEILIEQLNAGIPLSNLIREVDGFTRAFASAVKVGEESGKLEKTLESVSEYNDFETEIVMEQGISLVEPILLIVVSAMIGFIMLAIMLPIYGSYAAMELLL